MPWNASATLRPQASSKGLAFALLLPETPVLLQTDRRALRQIVLNLAGNANFAAT